MALLTMVSMGAWAQIDVQIANDGKFDGGTIEVTNQKDLDDGVEVTITVTPDKGYTIKKGAITVVSTYPPSGSRSDTRAPEIAGNLTLYFKGSADADIDDPATKRDYTFIVPSGFGAWVKEATFQEKKRDGAKSTPVVDAPLGKDFTGVYFIANHNRAGTANYDGYNISDYTKNFYLRPSSDTYDVAGEQPFLTTKKDRTNNTPKPDIAKWTIRYAKTESGTDYYYLIHSSNTYLTWHDPMTIGGGANATDRVRLHLQSTLDEDKALFYFTEGTKGDNDYNICLKGVNCSKNSPGSLNPAKDNKDNAAGVTISGAGTVTVGNKTIQCGGLIGIYEQNDPTGVWYLEDYIARPTISFNASNLIVITAQSGATSPDIRYTTNGTIPSNTNGDSYSGPFAPDDDVTTIKAVEIVDGKVSNVATFFTPVLFGNNHKYLIQSQNNGWTVDESTTDFHFYMIPGDEDNSITKVNTTSLFRPTMEWYFLNAGIEDGVQYYYIVNNVNGKYLCYDGTNKVYMGDYANDNKFKFKIVESSTLGTYNIYPYGQNVLINKATDNANSGAINTVNYNASNANSGNARWKFIVSSTLDKTAPFTVSDDTSISYYKIASVGSSGYYIVPGTPNVTTSNSSTDNNWYFEEAQAANASDWLTYYYLRNAETYEYLYFTKDANGNDPCLATSETITEGSENRYMFTWARTATEKTYYIVPKLLKDVSQNQISSLRKQDNKTGIFTNVTRGAGNFAWTFEPSTFKCEPPILTYDPLTGKISITCGTPGATIYFAHYDSEPSSSDIPELIAANVYNDKFDALPGYYKAVASRSTDGNDMSDVITSEKIEEFHCMRPIITKTLNHVTITCATPGATIYYIAGSGDFSETAENYGGSLYNPETGFDTSETVIKAIAVKGGVWSTKSSEALYDKTPTPITSTDDITNMDGVYIVDGSFTASGTIGSATDPFTGEFDGSLVEFNLSQPLFGYIDGAIIKNVIISSATVSTSSHTGAIANVAKGDSRIYNCGINSGSVSGSNYVGGLVGLLDGSARVINCYSYANITGGNYVGGIVGYNNVATTAANLKTMVMNCMFYGDIKRGNSKAPIYNGEIITNDGDANGVNNFNFFWGGASYVGSINVYNCALMAETRFLQRFEFFRYLLNSNRELAAWWVTGDVNNKDEIIKWVMDPSQIGTTTPYPILKTPGKYPSVVNYTPSETAYDEGHRNEGGKLTSMGTNGKLAVTIQMGSGGAYFSAPSGAGLKTGETGMFNLTITDMDFKHFNFNYGKVQLPYYNDYCDGNYTENRVVTGWKIVSITGTGSGTTSFSTDADDVTYTNGELTATPYNFADRKCTEKDLYGTSGRVFNQGAYWDVPDGVTAITIEPYWGKAVYLSDAYWDVTYKNSGTDAMATAANVSAVGGGQHYENGKKYNIVTRRRDDTNGQIVYTSMSNAIADAALYESISETSYSARSVYDYVVALVGNYHHTAAIAAGGKPYTVTSVDLDGDNEPDYSFMLRFNGRTGFHSVRYDFLNLIGLGMAQKTTGGTGSYNFGIMQPKYWFEVTNTALFRVTQFEYSPASRAKKPIILQGGVIEQWVTQQQDAGDAVEYFHVGGNVWFKEFHRGSHQDNEGKSTPHPPVSVTGGDFDKFYLTGLYQSKAATYDDNAECYISGGRFGEVAGAGMEGIGTSDGKGNITWVIDHADIKEFYGGGINAGKPIHGNIHTVIKNSYVTQFCGGPKFGDMENGRTVKTVAENCTFGTYFGAGYGGNSYSRFAPKNYNEVINIEWNNWIAGTSYPSSGNYGGYKLEYNSGRGGVATQFDYQFIPMSGNTTNVARLFIDYVSFSLATTHNVNSALNGCTINGNFYGGGSLGKVDGDITSTLTNCMVKGNVFGAGYSASRPTVEVMPTSGFITEPHYDEQSGSFIAGVLPSKETTTQTTTYTWKPQNGDKYIDTNERELYTQIDLSESNLGSVSGMVTLTLTTSGENGVTKIGTESDASTGYVYGGGDESYVYNSTTPANASTTVTLSGNTTVLRDVFGGGNRGVVSGSTTVNIKN